MVLEIYLKMQNQGIVLRSNQTEAQNDHKR